MPHDQLIFGAGVNTGWFKYDIDEIILYDGPMPDAYINWTYNDGLGRGFFASGITEIEASITNEHLDNNILLENQIFGYCNASINGTDTATIGYNFTWYRNGSYNKSGYVDGQVSNNKVNLDNITYTLAETESWIFSCMANSSGVTDSRWVNTSSKTVYSNFLNLSVLYFGDYLSGMNILIKNGTTLITNPFLLNKGNYSDGETAALLISGTYPSTNVSFPLYFSTSEYQVNLSFFGLDNCTNLNNISTNATTMNITFYDPDDNLVAVNYEILFDYARTSPYILNYSGAGTASNIRMCIYPSWGDIYTDIFISYDNQTYQAADVLLNNVTTHLQLYTLLDTTQVTFTVLDLTGTAIQDAYIHVMKWDVGDNAYLTTEILRTDSNGVAVANSIVLYTQYYKFIVIYEGQTKLVDPENQGIRIFSTTRTFRISIDETEWFDNYNTILEVYTNISFNATGTNSFVFTWVNPVGDSINGCLKVIKRNTTKETSLSDSCTDSASASIVYAITPAKCNTFYATGYFKFDGDIYVAETEVYTPTCDFTLYDLKGDQGKKESGFVAFLLIVTLALIGIASPVISFILFSLGLIVTVSLGMWQMSLQIVVGIIILGCFYIFRGDRNR